MFPIPSNPYRSAKIIACCALAVLAFFVNGRLGRLEAAPITAREAVDAASAWAGLSPEAMHEPHGQVAGAAVPDAQGAASYYVVNLAPRGYVVIAADDSVEPVIAFSTTDKFQAARGNPIYEMLRDDLPGRLARARAGRPEGAAKWRLLRNAIQAAKLLAPQTAGGPAPASVSDVRVAPLTKSEWNQTTVNGLPVYNYYTPPYGAGNANNYYSGCVATMLAQLMRFHQWPQDAVGTASYSITVNGSQTRKSLRGGDGNGGAYAWDQMPLVPGSGLTTGQQQAIGALVVDAGVASNMDYESDGSGAFISANVLTNAFHFASAAFSTSALSNLEVAVDANLDAGLPVGLGITGNGDGHAVVADGYGFNGGTEYHHINMGWSGACNAWYNLPVIIAGGYDFNTVDSALYNVDPHVKGEIISGRITNGGTKGVAGVSVTAFAGSVAVTATTNATGIYAFKGLSSNTKWTLAPAAAGLNFTPATLAVTTGKSGNGGGVGDRTGADFASQLITGSVSVRINASAATAGAEWRVNGGAWQAGGATVSGVPIGTGTISFHGVKGWSAPAAEPVTVTENQTTTVNVTFHPQYSLTAAPDNAANGSVSANPQPGELGSYAPGAAVTLTATAAQGFYFGGWVESGTLISTDASYTSVVKSARTLVANFPPATLTGQNGELYVTSNKAADVIDVLGSLSTTTGTLAILSVTQPAKGSVAINGDGTVTFTPTGKFRGNAQFSFTATDGQGGTITRTVTIANWFTASAGHYAGLSLGDDLTANTSGYLKAAVTASGAFTGKLTYAGASYGVAGVFDSNADFQKVIPRKDEASLTLTLHLDPATEITGTVSDGTNTSTITAQRLAYSAANKAPQAGKYSADLSSEGNGNGYLFVDVSPTGVATAFGQLADGTPVSTTGYVNPDGSLPFYAGIYKGTGSLLGKLDLEPAGTPQICGDYTWFRPASAPTNGTATGAMVNGN